MRLGRILIAVEFCPPLTAEALRAALIEDGLAQPLRAAEVELTLAYPLAPPGGVGELGGWRSALFELLRDSSALGVRFGLWPVLNRREWEPLLGADYYFLCTSTARIFERALGQLTGWGEAAPSHVLLDLEPPQFVLSSPARFLRPGWRSDFRAAERCHRRIRDDLARAGIASVACFFPPLLLENYSPAQSLLARIAAVAPFAADWDYLAPLYYSTFAERFFRLSRARAQRLAVRGVRRAVRRWRERAIPMLGTLGPGLMGEPDHLERSADLAFEIRQAKRNGAHRLGIYNLEGILYRYRRGRLVGKRGREEIGEFFASLEDFAKAVP